MALSCESNAGNTGWLSVSSSYVCVHFRATEGLHGPVPAAPHLPAQCGEHGAHMRSKCPGQVETPSP